jgi:hypothetical protein
LPCSPPEMHVLSQNNQNSRLFNYWSESLDIVNPTLLLKPLGN